MNYLEQCVEAVQSIDARQLEAMQVRTENLTGEGSSFNAYSLGRLSVAGELTHVGVKIPSHHPGTIENRIITDVTLITYLTEKVPILRPMVPRFLGVLATENEAGIAVITEDASEGKRYKSDFECPLPEDVELALFEAFAWAGKPVDVFDMNVVQNQMPFLVNGRSRLLDFNPSPFRSVIRRSDEYIDVRCAVEDCIGQMTVTVANESLLAQYVQLTGSMIR